MLQLEMFLTGAKTNGHASGSKGSDAGATASTGAASAGAAGSIPAAA